MCGIFGFLANGQYNINLAENWLLQGMSSIKHRGPDGSGKWISTDGQIGLGHVRLAVIDIETGSQPITSEDGRFTIIFNGEIYNYLELRDELGDRSFRTNSDTEVVLRAFQHWGKECLSRFRGMFAFAIWDSAIKQLFLARDHFGVKPLYWANTHKGLFFASELKALLPFLLERKLNSNALSDYFTFQFYLDEKTLIKDVWQMPAAHFATISPGTNLISKRYWEVRYDINYSQTENWFIQRLRELMEDSVRMNIRSDVEVGSYVSGGIDSSLLASIAKDVGKQNSFKIFNGRFSDNPNFDESKFAKALADENAMDLYVVDIGEQDFVDNIAKVIWHLDQPIAGPGSFPQFMVSKLVSEHVKVVLGGQGGDEIFGGYVRYLVAYLEQCIIGAIDGTLNNGNYLVTYESIISNLTSLQNYKPMLREFWAKGLFDERDKRYWHLINRSNTFNEIIVPELLNCKEKFEEFSSIFWSKNIRQESYFDSMTHFDFKTLLPALLQVEDRMSMAHGVEARVPFLDKSLVEFAATIPANIKFQNGELKRMLRKTFSSRLPKKILDRKDKMGFPVPLNLWLKTGGKARDFIGDVFGSKKANQRPYLKNGISIDLLLDSQSVYGRNLWALLSLELWHQQFID